MKDYLRIAPDLWGDFSTLGKWTVAIPIIVICYLIAPILGIFLQFVEWVEKNENLHN